jgi:hypothetical protein
VALRGRPGHRPNPARYRKLKSPITLPRWMRASPQGPEPTHCRGVMEQLVNSKVTCNWNQCKVSCLGGGRSSYRRKRPSARHSDPDIVHAYNNPIRVEELDDELFMLIGADRAGNLLEIGIASSSVGPIIVHAMEARPKYLR